MTPLSFGQKIRILRMVRGWSQKELADRAGVGHRTIYLVESGNGMKGQTLNGLKAVFGVALDDPRVERAAQILNGEEVDLDARVDYPAVLEAVDLLKKALAVLDKTTNE